MDWKNIKLSGASRISRVCGEYEVVAPKVPHGGRFKIKVLEEVEESDGMFFAMANVCLKDSKGSPDWLGGFGKSEVEAIEKLLKWFMDELAKRESCTPDDFEWSDPLDF
jgi:hypothetical protein